MRVPIQIPFSLIARFFSYLLIIVSNLNIEHSFHLNFCCLLCDLVHDSEAFLNIAPYHIIPISLSDTRVVNKVVVILDFFFGRNYRTLHAIILPMVNIMTSMLFVS